MSNKKIVIFLVVLFSLGFILRLWGIGFGLPHHHHYHPDEVVSVRLANAFFERGHLIPHDWDKPPLHAHLAALCFTSCRGLRFLGAYFLGLTHSLPEVVITRSDGYLLTRLVSAVLGSLTVFLVFWAGRILFERKVAILAALFITLAKIHVFFSHYGNVYITLTFFVFLTFLFSCLILKNNRHYWYILAGTSAGLAVMSNFNGFISILPIFLAHWLCFGTKKGIKKGRLLLVAGFFFVLGLIIGGPHILSNPLQFWSDIAWKWHKGNIGRISHTPYSLIIPWDWDIFPLLILTIGTGWFIIRHKKEDLLLIALPLVYLVNMLRIPQTASRYLLLLAPFFVLLLARIIFELNKHLRFFKKGLQYTITVFLSGLILLPWLWQDLVDGYFFQQKDTRTLAQEWIEENIPEGAKIALENYCPDPRSLNKNYPLLGASPLSLNSLDYYREEGVDYLVASNLLYGRFTSPWAKSFFPKENRFYEQLGKECQLVKRLRLRQKQFNNPVIKIYHCAPILKKQKLPIFPEDCPEFPETDLYKFIFLNGIVDKGYSQRLTGNNRFFKRIIVSDKPLKTIGLILINSGEKGVVEIEQEGRRKRLRMLPWEKRLVILKKPRQSFPYTGYIYKLRITTGSPLLTVKLIPEFFPPYEILLTRCWKKNPKETIFFLEQMDKNNPSNAFYLYLLGLSYAENRERQKAFSLYEQAGKLDPNFLEACQQIARGNHPYLNSRLKENYLLNKVEYESENLPASGKVAADNKASGGKAVKAGKGEKKIFAWGPYQKLLPGEYRISFRLKTNKVIRDTVACLDIHAGRGKYVVEKLKIRGDDFKKADKYQDFTLNFYNFTSKEKWEFRVATMGKTDLWVDKIAVSSPLEPIQRWLDEVDKRLSQTSEN